MMKISLMSLTIIITMAMMFNLMVEKIKSQSFLKNSFECGFNPISQKKMTFSTNFLLISMMFLIFDIEVTFMIPMMLLNKMNKLMLLSLCSMFLLILCLILMKEWKQGSLEWNK